MYPTPAAPKFTHIAKVSRFNIGHTRHTLCGRMVNLMAIGHEHEATCTKCVAESLARNPEPVKEN